MALALSSSTPAGLRQPLILCDTVMGLAQLVRAEPLQAEAQASVGGLSLGRDLCTAGAPGTDMKLGLHGPVYRQPFSGALCQ